MLVIIFLILGCDEEEPIPGYISVDSFQLITSPSQGKSTSKFADVWFYSDNKFLGAYSLPSTFPTLEVGARQIELFAGILKNGNSSTPAIYPFVQSFSIGSVVESLDTIELQPMISYHSNVAFRMIDGFEGNTFFVENLDPFDQTMIETIRDPDDENNQVGFVNLTRDQNEIEVATGMVFQNLPRDGTPVFIEMDYRNEVEISVGLIGRSGGAQSVKSYFVNLRTQAKWNKIYIELTEQIQDSQLQGYQVTLRAIHDNEKVMSRIWVDNIKLIHFE